VKDMHIYMEPLIDELLDLYENGIDAVDASASAGSQQFILKAALLWTIHDWPGQTFLYTGTAISISISGRWCDGDQSV
jgi:hypothetical protein